MGDDSQRLNRLASGLALVLDGEDRKESSQKNRLVSYCDDFGEQSLERTLEHIFDLPSKTINPLTCQVDADVICTIIKNDYLKHHKTLLSVDTSREGVSAIVDSSGPYSVNIDVSSVSGEFQLIKPPLLVESHAVFSSARANACVWKGKWMYEVTLETAGLQQLGWATISCSFAEHTGVGDADGSYAYDGDRVIKWNLNAEPYGQSWVIGDVIGCCIDLEIDEISYYRNGISLGVAFSGIRKMVPGIGYYPAFSLSQGERCDLNFGARPFRYPIQGFHPIQVPPSTNQLAVHLLHCFSKLLNMWRGEKSSYNSMEKLRRLKRFMPVHELYNPVSRGICMELFSSLDANADSVEYISWGPLLSFLMDVFQDQAPHDYESLDRVLDILLTSPGSTLMFEHLLSALSYCCKTASIVLTESPYTGSYPYLALVCHMLRREEFMVVWWKMSDFEILFEGFLSQRCLNKQDLQCLIPAVWWPGSCEDISYESSMMLTTRTLTEAIDKIEEKHRDLCCLVMQFIPPVTPAQLPGYVFRTFLQNIILRNRGADRNIPPPGVSSNSVLVTLFTVILHFLSEGFAMRGCGLMMGSGTSGGPTIGFLHRGGQQSFPLPLILKNDPHRVEIPRLGGSYSHLASSHPVNVDPEAEVVRWEEGCVDDVDPETRITHLGIRKPCCCLSLDVSFSRISKNPFRYTTKASQSHCNSIPERSAQVASECSAGNLNDDIVDKPSTSGQSDSEFGYRPLQQMRVVALESTSSSSTLIEEELLDAMLLLYHLGLAPNFKQASTYMSHQSHSISQLEETDRQLRERCSGEQLRRLKEARSVYREEVIESVRHCAWYRVSLFARWKQRGMYAACMWTVQLLLVLSKNDLVFSYVPEFYLETLVDCFHVLRKSDPPFVPAGMFIKQGLTSFVTFVVTHFSDPRILSAELRDLLLQSISVLVQYKEFLAAFECNQAAIHSLSTSLLSSFDNRSWIPVTNILIRLCKGSGFGVGLSKHGESSSTSCVFQNLLREACLKDEELFSAFLNRLFNTLSWAMTEFSVSIREMQEKGQMIEFQQRKCSVIFDLSSNLARVLEFCTCEIPQAFLLGADTNLRRLVELVVFVLNHLTSVTDPEFFDLTLRRTGQTPEKVNRGMILAPLVGIILNLLDASLVTDSRDQNDILSTFASMDCADTVISGFQYLLEFNWAGTFTGDVHLTKLRQLEDFSSHLISRTLVKRVANKEETESDDNVCCICYTCEADAKFLPCTHVSCFGCINRHLINCERCFFCNATVLEVVQNTCEI